MRYDHALRRGPALGNIMTEARNKLVLATLATVVALVALGLWLLRGEAAVVANAAP